MDMLHGAAIKGVGMFTDVFARQGARLLASAATCVFLAAPLLVLAQADAQSGALTTQSIIDAIKHDAEMPRGRPVACRWSHLPDLRPLPQPDLRQQGHVFGRMVAFMEKAGLPRTRVPTQVELDPWRQRCGQGIERLTLGNNLEACRLARATNGYVSGEGPLSC